MGFRLIPKLVTLNDLERRNGRVFCVISPNFYPVGPINVKLVEDTLILSASKLEPKESILVVYHLWPYS